MLPIHKRSPLPASLTDAFAWTDAAGEIEELASLTDDALETYARESAANNRKENGGDGSVSESDLLDLAAWLRAGAKETCLAGGDY